VRAFSGIQHSQNFLITKKVTYQRSFRSVTAFVIDTAAKSFFADLESDQTVTILDI